MDCNEEEPSAITVIAQTPSLPPQKEHLEMKIHSRICIFIYGAKHSSTQRATKQTEHWIPTWECNTTPNCKSWICCQICFRSSVLGRGGRREWCCCFWEPSAPRESMQQWMESRNDRKTHEHCAHRGLRLVPRRVKAGPAMCALCMREDLSQQSPSSSFPSARGHNLCWKVFFKTRKTVKTAAREGCKRRARKGICSGSGYILSALHPSKKGEQDINLIYSASYMRFMPSSYHQSGIKQLEVRR